jgi:hypothetical protein
VLFTLETGYEDFHEKNKIDVSHADSNTFPTLDFSVDSNELATGIH